MSFIERRRRWSDTYKGVPVSDDEEELDGGPQSIGSSGRRTPGSLTTPDDDVSPASIPVIDPQLKKEEHELSKIATGIGKVFLQNVREREKLRQWKLHHMDPRNASRTPSANKEPAYRLRYESPVNACK